ncbi:MAG: hypothetical protein DME55_07795 [Verrucomicrobia bacterium]|nr:MAG: hypothetical protein DME55_07795 [Verrucomicrobiota bacterium]
MENVEKIHAQLAMRPFRPFWIVTHDGSQIRIDRAQWYWEPPGGFGEFAVFDTHGYSLLNYRDVSSVVVVETPPPPPQP